MKKNEEKEIVKKEKYSGTWNGQEVAFNREWSGHRFTDQECEALLNGQTIIIEAISKKSGNKFSVSGQLGMNEYEGKTFCAFQPDFNRKIIPISLNGHIFSNKERKNLEDGKSVYVIDFVSKAGKEYSATVTFNEKNGIKLEFE